MERFNLLEGSGTFDDQTMRVDSDRGDGVMGEKSGGKQMGNEEKKAAVHEEMMKVNQLPARSGYAVHRMKVLNKILQLLSVQRTISQDEELELLFAGLSI